MKFGKLENGILTLAPSTLTIGGKVHYHPSDRLYLDMGYMPVVDTPYPDITGTITQDGDPTPDSPVPIEVDVPYYTDHYELQDGQIVKVWTESEPPIPVTPSPSVEDRLILAEAKNAELEEQLSAIMEAVDYLILGGDVNG